MTQQKYNVAPIRAMITKEGHEVGFVEFNNNWANNWNAVLTLSFFSSELPQEIKFYGTAPRVAEAIKEAEEAMAHVATQLMQQFKLLENKEGFELKGNDHYFAILSNGNMIGKCVKDAGEWGEWVAIIQIQYKYFIEQSIQIYGFGTSKAAAITDALPKITQVINQLKHQLSFFQLPAGA